MKLDKMFISFRTQYWADLLVRARNGDRNFCSASLLTLYVNYRTYHRSMIFHVEQSRPLLIISRGEVRNPLAIIFDLHRKFFTFILQCYPDHFSVSMFRN